MDFIHINIGSVTRWMIKKMVFHIRNNFFALSRSISIASYTRSMFVNHKYVFDKRV